MILNIIYNEDCIKGMLDLPEKSVDVIITSPPYNLNIKYGSYKDNKERDDYLDWLNDVFSAIKWCLKDNGHFWLNMGYSNIDPWIGMDVANIARNHFVLQNNFIWVKSISIDNVTSGHFKPINSERFSNTTWEHLFHFTKSGDIKVDKLSVGVPYMYDSNIDKGSRMRGRLVKKMGYENQRDFNKNATDEIKREVNKKIEDKMKNKPVNNSRCKGNSWYIPYDTINNRNKHRGSHPATYPIKLVEDCIKFSAISENSIVVDPFIGSGTTAIGALKQNMNYIGFDIDQSYIDFANDRIEDFEK